MSKRSKKLKARIKEKNRLEDAFDILRLSKKIENNGEKTVEAYILFDHVKVLRHFSFLPQQFFNILNKQLIRGVKITDSSLKNSSTGHYKYSLDISVQDKSLEYIKSKIKILDEVISLAESKKFKESLDLLYNDVLETSILDSFTIKITLKSKRIKSKNNFLEFNSLSTDKIIADAKEASSLRLKSDLGEVVEWGIDDTTIQPALNFKLEDALEIFSDMTPEKESGYMTIVRKTQKRLIDAIGGKNIDPTQSNAIRARVADFKKPMKHTVEFKEVLDMSDFCNGLLHQINDSSNILRPEDSLLQNYETVIAKEPQNIIADGVMSQEVDFIFLNAQSEATEKVFCKAGDKPLEVLDVEDLKYISSRQNVEKKEQKAQEGTVQSLFSDILGPKEDLPEVELEYLSGYQKGIMKAPVWLPLTEEVKGKEVLCRVKQINSKNRKLIYNEYFVKKV